MRKRMLTLALGVALTVAASGIASATDFGSIPPPVGYQPQFSWAGAYVGLHFGAAGGVSRDSEEPNVSLGGQYIGAHIGYNAMLAGNLMFGVEADYSSGGIGGFVQYIDSDPMLGPVTLTEDIDWFASLRGRVGYVMGDWMPYLTLGWARAGSTRTTGLLQERTERHAGWTIGAGVEWMFMPQWTLRGEYRYYSFDAVNYDWAVGGPSMVDFNFSTVEIGVNYKF